jgi:hypothetical protein
MDDVNAAMLAYGTNIITLFRKLRLESFREISFLHHHNVTREIPMTKYPFANEYDHQGLVYQLP